MPVSRSGMTGFADDNPPCQLCPIIANKPYVGGLRCVKAAPGRPDAGVVFTRDPLSAKQIAPTG